MGSRMLPGQRSGVPYRRRRMKPTPFVMAAFTTLGIGVAIAVVHSRLGTLVALVCLASFLILCYLDGPAQSVSVRSDTLIVKNWIFQYEVPPARILSIEYIVDLCVLLRVEGRAPISVGAFSRGQMRWKRLPAEELEANARSLTDALFTRPAPADARPVERRLRWANVLLLAAGGVSVLIVHVVLHYV